LPGSLLFNVWLREDRGSSLRGVGPIRSSSVDHRSPSIETPMIAWTQIYGACTMTVDGWAEARALEADQGNSFARAECL